MTKSSKLNCNSNIVDSPQTNSKITQVTFSGDILLNTPHLNKGTAFTTAEREQFHLRGKLPAAIETIEQQVGRAYQQYLWFTTPEQKNWYLQQLYLTNYALFFALIAAHLEEIIPIIYTPHVATAIHNFSQNFMRPHGLYLTAADEPHLNQILADYSEDALDIIVITDGERILGIGDQGVGGIGICIGKLLFYTLFNQIDHKRTLPIVLDVGTNNQQLLSNPHYLGVRAPRLTGLSYDKFVAKVINAIKTKFPRVFLHWEDFGRENASKLLYQYRERLCSFNDDIQGTGVVTLAALQAAWQLTQQNLREQKIVFFGAGTSALGIAEQIYRAMLHCGVSADAAYQQFWFVDCDGLLTTHHALWNDKLRPFCKKATDLVGWKLTNSTDSHDFISLLDVVTNVKPTVLIGCSTVGGAFNETIVRTMAAEVARPIIFPLSNPTANSEAHPEDLLRWTEGRAIVATGSPYAPVQFGERIIPITQCNNLFAFPGIGAGCVAVKARMVSDAMLLCAAQTLLQESPASPIQPDTDLLATTCRIAPLLLPELSQATAVAHKIARAVAACAIREGYAQI